MELGLSGKNALITGSSSGLGYSIAEGFLKEGASVILTGRNTDSLVRAEDILKATYRQSKSQSFSGDLTDQNVINNLYNFIKSDVGKIDHLVCNIGSGKSVPVLDEDIDEWDRMLKINLISCSLVINKFKDMLSEASKKNNAFSTITIISSICGIKGFGAPVAYSSAKAALISYAKSISVPLAKKGIRVNAVSPGNILFPGSTWENKLNKSPDKTKKYIDDSVALQRFASPDEVADIVLFLASNKASFVVGSNWVVDGGQLNTYFV